MDWARELYDDFRMKHGFGSIPKSRTAKEVDFLVDRLALAGGKRVLDLFCGIGRHCVELAKRGIDATGVDVNPRYLAVAAGEARRAGVSPAFIEGDVREVDLGVDYDAVIIMYQSFGYFDDVEERRLLRRVHDALKSGGRFFIEILNRDSILRNFQAVSEREYAGVRVVEEREFDVLTSRIYATIRRFESGGVVERTVNWRMYSAHEIRSMCEDAGLRFVAGYSNIQGQPLTLNARLMRLVFERE